MSTDTERVVDEAIRLTVWGNIRRYLILSGVGFIIVDLAITLTVVVLLANATREADKDRATAACKNTAALAEITRTSVEEQAKSTEDLRKSGDTLGLSREKFDRLVKESAARDELHLAALDKLVKADCEDI